MKVLNSQNAADLVLGLQLRVLRALSCPAGSSRAPKDPAAPSASVSCPAGDGWRRCWKLGCVLE